MLVVCTVYNVQCTMYSVQCTVYNVQCTMYCVQCTVYNVQCTVYSVQCTVYNVLCTMYSVQCTVYNVQCTVYNVQCTVYNVHSSLTLLLCGTAMAAGNEFSSAPEPDIVKSGSASPLATFTESVSSSELSLTGSEAPRTTSREVYRDKVSRYENYIILTLEVNVITGDIHIDITSFFNVYNWAESTITRVTIWSNYFQ